MGQAASQSSGRNSGSEVVPEVEVIDVSSKPVVAEGLLRGDYDSGLTHLEHLEEHQDLLRLDLDIGEIVTTWVVYGTTRRFEGEVIGIPSKSVLRREATRA